MLTFFITGGCGFIGSHFIELALRKKYRVINLDKLTYAATRTDISHPNYKLIKGDIRDQEIVSSIFKKHSPNFIINFAAESHVDRSIVNPTESLSTNIIGPINLLEEYIKNNSKARFLNVSTDEVYGSLQPEDPPFCEDSPYKPRSPYAASKAATDHILQSYIHTYNLDLIITNCSNNYGPFQHPEKLIPLVIQRAIEKKSIPVYGNGTNVRDWIYVKDHVNLLLKIILQKKLPKNQFLIGGQNEISNIKLINYILSVLETHLNYQNLKELITYVEDRPGHDFRYAIDNSFISKVFKFKPSSFNETLIETILHYVKISKNQEVSHYDYSNFRI